ncbi:MAG: helix-turn-helix transcriptional regulator [Bacteroidota bacterium]
MKRDADKGIAIIINELILSRGAATYAAICDNVSQRYGKETDEAEIDRIVEGMQDSRDENYIAPVIFTPEKGGFCYADPEDNPLQTALTEAEKKELQIAFSLLDQFKYRDLFRSFSGIIQKMLDVMRINTFSGKADGFDFIDFEKIAASRGSRFLFPLIAAIEGKKVVELIYQPFYEERSHSTIVHPYLLKEYRYRWYLIGRNDLSGEIRTYGLDRVIELGLSDKTYIEKDFSAGEYFRYTIGVIAPPGPPPLIRIRVDKPQALYLITQPWHESQNIELEEENAMIFSFRVHPTYEFKSLVLSIGRDLEVLEPDSLREEIGNVHEVAARRYKRRI